MPSYDFRTFARYRQDAKGVDRQSSILWSKGHILIRDATCSDTLVLTNIKNCSEEGGSAAATRRTVLFVH